MSIPRKPDTAIRRMSGYELDKANEKHAAPEFVAAGDRKWIVLINEEGLKRLVDGYHFTERQYQDIKKHIDAGIPANNYYDYEVGQSGERNRYAVLFEGATLQEAKAVYAMSGQLSQYYQRSGPKAVTDTALRKYSGAGSSAGLNSGLDISRYDAKADRVVTDDGKIQDHILAVVSPQFALEKPHSERLASLMSEWSAYVGERQADRNKGRVLELMGQMGSMDNALAQFASQIPTAGGFEMAGVPTIRSNAKKPDGRSI